MTEKHLRVDLSGKTAIVTGGSRGIGKAISLALAQAGANVVIAARTEEESSSLPGTIHKTAEEIKELGGQALPVRCDVTSTEDIQKMVEKTIDTYGTVDILVNNAGVLHGASFLQTEPEDFQNVLAVNVSGPFLCSRAVLPQMISQKSGSIVNISSGLAESTHPGNNIYSATKAALNRMMLKLSAEVAEHNIAVNLVNPGMIRSDGMMARMQGAMSGHNTATNQANQGMAQAPADIMSQLPSPSIVGPPVVWLAAQDAASFTGKIAQVATFGSEWP